MFKRLLVLPLVLLLFCGCSQKRSTRPILNNISFVAQIDYCDNNFICDATVTESNLKLVVNEPDKIKGLTFVANKNGISAEFMGISYNPNINNLSQGVLVKLLFNIFTDISNNEFASCEGDNCKISGRVDNYKYVFYFSPTGLPICLEVATLNLKIDFKNVTVN